SQLATGHYARVVRHRGRLLLARGADAGKDQSYMLGRLDPRLLDRIWFPLGEQTKEDTRAEADQAGLAVARRADSQEACFLGGDYREFLRRHGAGEEAGEVVDEHGRALGEHGGFWRFTPGQRRGIGVAAAKPLYVLSTDPAANRVVVGPRESLAVETISARGRLYVRVDRAEVKWRYRSPAVPATVEETEQGFRLVLEEPAYGVAAGQAAVLYEDDVVVGAGVLSWHPPGSCWRFPTKVGSK